MVLAPGRAALLVVALAACNGAPKGDAEGEGPQAATAADPAATPPRRPTRRYYLGRTRERCEVYSVDGDAIAPPLAVPCPPDLQPGERFRITGKTCIRESPSDTAREVPVVCPDPLTNLEKDDLANRDGGT